MKYFKIRDLIYSNTRKEHFKAIAPGMNLSAVIGNTTFNPKNGVWQNKNRHHWAEVFQYLKRKEGDTRKEHLEAIAGDESLSSHWQLQIQSEEQSAAEQESTALNESASGFIRPHPPLLLIWTPREDKRFRNPDI
ncbi:hypothetical protein CDAR_84931 [Caerostris darwini]|uniref:Uncharacterized protein n=1 Tax=Caerostris darwini TaxID=1538125 RepID=A0AAV4PKU9_9ARAC|nr:hypothetical protein CDAR_84931 [Caerostris darwini]